jgi:hypothetical protein
LFIIGKETIEAASVSEIEHTYADLKELNLHHLPYPRCVVRVPARAPVSDEWVMKRRSRPGWIDPYLIKYRDGFMFDIPWGWFECRLYEPRGVDLYIEEKNVTDFEKEDGSKDWELKTCAKVEQLLVVLLATKNAHKITHVDKLACMGIGTKRHHRFAYTTTISVPTDARDDEHLATPGKPKRAHLRRGHIRRQRFGPGFEFIKKIWIAPIFVNADEDFVDSRGAYNVNLPFR